MTNSLKSWVAFDDDGFPFGFLSADRYNIAQAAREFPKADRIELFDGERRSELLRIHAGTQ